MALWAFMTSEDQQHLVDDLSWVRSTPTFKLRQRIRELVKSGAFDEAKEVAKCSFEEAIDDRIRIAALVEWAHAQQAEGNPTAAYSLFIRARQLPIGQLGPGTHEWVVSKLCLANCRLATRDSAGELAWLQSAAKNIDRYGFDGTWLAYRVLFRLGQAYRNHQDLGCAALALTKAMLHHRQLLSSSQFWSDAAELLVKVFEESDRSNLAEKLRSKINRHRELNLA